MIEIKRTSLSYSDVTVAIFWHQCLNESFIKKRRNRTTESTHDPFFLEAFLTTHLCSSSPTLTPQEVLNMLKESKADIYVDPVLHTACALDIKHHCAAIPPGKGRRESNSLRSHVTQTRKTNIPLFISTTGCYSAAVRTKEGQTLILLTPAMQCYLFLIR